MVFLAWVGGVRVTHGHGDVNQRFCRFAQKLTHEADGLILTTQRRVASGIIACFRMIAAACPIVAWSIVFCKRQAIAIASVAVGSVIGLAIVVVAAAYAAIVAGAILVVASAIRIIGNR